MDRNTLRRYEVLVYFCIGLIASILFLLGSHVVTAGTLNIMILNLSSGLLCVAIIFFIVNRMFPIENSNSYNTELSQDVKKVLNKLNGVDKDIKELTKEITSEVEDKQKKLIKIIEDNYTEELRKSYDQLTRAIKNELRSSFNEHNSQAQNESVQRIVELIINSTQTMGSYQRSVIDEKTKDMFKDMLEKISRPVENLSSDVKILESQLQKVENKVETSILLQSSK